MPRYVFRCDSCGKEQEETRKIDERDAAPPACACGAETKRVPPLTSGNFPGADRWR